MPTPRENWRSTARRVWSERRTSAMAAHGHHALFPSTFSCRRQIEGPNVFPIDHCRRVVPDIPDTDLAFRLLSLEIYSRFDRCFFQVAHRPCLTIYDDL